ncbi:Hypothetical protein NTJ_02774 [Nesidiocoris tenuis]|uniref:Uncharacterized protein n=1 Tax=Nesidiocoris tenuis TaxID=355587 RepID=A0ABN7ACE1_9HEMI|nr:Hypothetical protein NTJ_02774 [Nesidiocoris tenuis]
MGPPHSPQVDWEWSRTVKWHRGEFTWKFKHTFTARREKTNIFRRTLSGRQAMYLTTTGTPRNYRLVSVAEHGLTDGLRCSPS